MVQDKPKSVLALLERNKTCELKNSTGYLLIRTDDEVTMTSGDPVTIKKHGVLPGGADCIDYSSTFNDYTICEFDDADTCNEHPPCAWGKIRVDVEERGIRFSVDDGSGGGGGGGGLSTGAIVGIAVGAAVGLAKPSRDVLDPTHS